METHTAMVISLLMCCIHGSPLPVKNDLKPQQMRKDLNIQVHFVDRFVPQIEKTIRETVSVISSVVALKHSHRRTVFRISRDISACGSVYFDGPNTGKCAGISKSYSGDFCGMVPIPLEHLDGLSVYNFNDSRCLSESLLQGDGFIDGTNFVVYVTSQESSVCHNYFAHSMMCRIELISFGGVRSGRPVAGTVNLCKSKLENLTGVLLRRVIAHEMVHLLGFNYRSILEFIECDEEMFSSMPMSSSETIDSDISEGMEQERGLLCWKRRDVIQVAGRNEVVLQSEDLHNAALQIKKFRDDCNYTNPHKQNESNTCTNDWIINNPTQVLKVKNITNHSIDNNARTVLNPSGGITLAKTGTGLHWPDDIFPLKTSLMVPGDLESKEVTIDPLTIAILKTSGWYTVTEGGLRCIDYFLNLENIPESCITLFKKKTTTIEPVLPLFEEPEEENCTFSEKTKSQEEPSLEFTDPVYIEQKEESSFSKLKTGKHKETVKEELPVPSIHIEKEVHPTDLRTQFSTSKALRYLPPHMLLHQILAINIYLVLEHLDLNAIHFHHLPHQLWVR